MKRISLLLLTCTFLSVTSFGQTTYEFLRLDMSARAGALGGSYVTNNDDVEVIFYNPAGINFLENSPAQPGSKFA